MALQASGVARAPFSGGWTAARAHGVDGLLLTATLGTGCHSAAAVSSQAAGHVVRAQPVTLCCTARSSRCARHESSHCRFFAFWCASAFDCLLSAGLHSTNIAGFASLRDKQGLSRPIIPPHKRKTTILKGRYFSLRRTIRSELPIGRSSAPPRGRRFMLCALPLCGACARSCGIRFTDAATAATTSQSFLQGTTASSKNVKTAKRSRGRRALA